MTMLKKETTRPEVLELSLILWEQMHGYRPKITACMKNGVTTYTVHIRAEA